MDAAERRRQALELRKAGVDFRTIADRLGYEGPSGAHKAVTTALKALTAEPAEELRTLELERLDAMLRSLWVRATNAKGADLGAIDRVLKIMERRAKLAGLDAPSRINVAMMVETAADELGLTPDERAALMSDVETFIADQKAATV